MILFDTLSRKKKILKPRSGKMIEIFVCGPTVYDYSHIGHARTYIAFDAFVKYLRFHELEVRYVQNITDIDDKIINRARELDQPASELAKNFETEYYHDMETLGIDSVDKYARATDFIPQIISQIKRLTDMGYAYDIPGEGIYFDITKFKNYGKLSHRTAKQAEDAVSRIDESTDKRNRGDFALWKFSKPGEPMWDFKTGECLGMAGPAYAKASAGKPGWHIEDTAITETEFGPQYDIHGGARDLMFPHHESEIAQMEAISGKAPLVNYWMHTGFLTVGGEKMSKSLGNFITIHEFLRMHTKEVLRLFVLSSHYRSPIDYTEKAVKQAEVNVKRLEEFYNRISKAGTVPALKQGQSLLLRYKKQFYKELEDDFNTPKALAVLLSLVREGNALIAKGKLGPHGARQILEFLNGVGNIFGIIPKIKVSPIPEGVLGLVKKREQLRKEEKWEGADKIRKGLEESGYIVEDTPAGPEIKITKPAQ